MFFLSGCMEQAEFSQADEEDVAGTRAGVGTCVPHAVGLTCCWRLVLCHWITGAVTGSGLNELKITGM